MSSMSVTTHSSLPSRDIAGLPQLYLHIGSHLAPPDLLSCVLVCHQWYEHFMPALWHTLDTSSTTWRHILAHYDSDLSIGKQDEQWLQDIFNKHGHYIRHLHIHHREIFQLANLSKGCTQLQSLRVYDIESNLTAKEKNAQELRPRDARGQLQGLEGSLLSPEFEGVFQPCPELPRSLVQHKRDWYAIQHLWLLIAKNSELRTLCFYNHVYLAFRLASDYFHDTVAGLSYLEELECHSDLFINLGTLLSRQLPSLRRLTLIDQGDSEQWPLFHGLEYLNLRYNVTDRTFFHALKHLPNLNTFVVKSIYFRFALKQDNGTIPETPSRLKRLEISEIKKPEREDYELAQRILPALPHLTSFKISQLYPLTANGLSVHCPNLERLEQGQEEYTLLPVRGVRPAVNSLNVLLQTCSKFKEFVGVRLQVDAEDILRQRWASCESLEVLPCQISGFGRLTKDENELYDAIPEPKLQKELHHMLSEEEIRVVEKRKQSRELQEKVCARLGELTHLKELDLGYFLDKSSHQTATQYVGNYGQPAEQRVGRNASNYEPVQDTLELTLDSGLRRLAGLKNLEVFGFEGMDHSIGESELRWMVENWPKIRVLRGLGVGRGVAGFSVEGWL
ncbi:hypothetical protein BKA57DRAFT_454176 [Linnemannia elongata]|nr:hypothetical protein BKA57DRAFT_454176 [Linnemannia elongata]